MPPPDLPSLLLVPSLLAGNHARLAESADRIAQGGLPWAHLDIMDGHFVPNLTFGPQMLADLAAAVPLFYDTHLMLEEPDRYVEAFARAGAGLISIHAEARSALGPTLRRIRSLGPRNGLVLNPDTPAEAALPFLPEVDLILCMTVQPGFGGQPFRTDVLPKIATLARWRTERHLGFRLEVDGGVDARTAPLCRAAGADTLVAGTAFFRAPDPAAWAAHLLATLPVPSIPSIPSVPPEN